ncbi:hypothetical protein ACLK17_11545 [Escherichia coli]
MSRHFLPVPTPVVRYRRFALPWRGNAPTGGRLCQRCRLLFGTT